MKFQQDLVFGGRKLPLILQNEAAECGLACLGMIAGFHGLSVDMSALRRAYGVSMMGMTLNHLIQTAQSLSLETRAVKLDLDDLANLKRPCILHWNFNHFVVLRDVKARSIIIHDPASGIREIGFDEVSRCFTGVALECWPNEGFKTGRIKSRVGLRQLMGRVSGLAPSLIQVLVLALVLELFVLVSPFYLQWVIDDVVVAADHDLLVTLALSFGMLVVLQHSISLLRGWVLLYLSTTLSLQWRSNLFAHMLRLPVSFFENRHLGDVVSRFSSVDVMQRTLTTQFIEAILDGIMSALVLAVMFAYSPKLAGIALSVMLGYLVLRWLWWRPFRNATEEQIVHAARQQSHFLETVRGIKPLKLFERIGDRKNTWSALLVSELNATLRTQKMQLYYRHANAFMFGLERIVIIAFGAGMVLTSEFTIGALMAFLAYKDQFSQRSSTLVDSFFEIRMLRLHGERLAEIALAEPEAGGSALADLQLADPLPPSAGVCLKLKELRYRYSPMSPWVLDGIDLEIRSGESVAIVGESGSGKSTLMHVLLGLRTPFEGRIDFFGKDIHAYPPGVLRKMLGTVTQDDMLFAGSLSENITFFDPAPDLEKMKCCARMAAIHDDIENMPMEYNTLVGDMGTVLSGGQKQRIFLARALYREPTMLVLDEATSNLDVVSEERVNAAIASLKLTRIIIAHRPQTISSTDRVLVMRHGKIVADLPSGDFATIRKHMSGELAPQPA